MSLKSNSFLFEWCKEPDHLRSQTNKKDEVLKTLIVNGFKNIFGRIFFILLKKMNKGHLGDYKYI